MKDLRAGCQCSGSARAGATAVEANVTVIFKKKRQRCEPGNYRPVSSTLQIGKLFERNIRDHLVKLEDESLRDSQHSFKTARSCLIIIIIIIMRLYLLSKKVPEQGSGIYIIYNVQIRLE